MNLDYIKRFTLIVFVLWSTILHATPIDISSSQKLSVLEQSSVYVDELHLDIHEIIKKDPFETYDSAYINIGTSQDYIWIKIKLKNPTQESIKKLLILSSPLLEHIALYKEGELTSPVRKGVLNRATEHTTLLPYFAINLEPNTSQNYYLKVNSFYEPVDFGLTLEDKNVYFAQDRAEQFMNIMLIGMVIALMLYSFLVSIYLKDKTYSFYSFYLFFLVYQQLTYLGLTQLYFPSSFVVIDIAIPVVKIGLLIITSALYAMYFLKTHRMPILHMVYKFFIVISLIEIAVFSFPSMYNLNIVIITGALFIVFNLFTGIYAYAIGYKQARLFIVGFSIVFASYILMIMDALGMTYIMQDLRNILMYTTAFEALILTLAFADRYVILQAQKEEVDTNLLQELKNRSSIVEAEVTKKTKELNNAVETKELLLKEVHHRVKNNLQVILSIIRLQNDEIDDNEISQKLVNLENRVNAISKTYNMLMLKEDIEVIDMQEYIDTLIADIQYTFHTKDKNISIETNVDAVIPLSQSIYIGLIINELLTNSYKYAFKDNTGSIYISLQHKLNNYTLAVEDDGQGFTVNKMNTSLGLKLIDTLVYGQLGGEMDVSTKNHTKYTIRFTL